MGAFDDVLERCDGVLTVRTPFVDSRGEPIDQDVTVMLSAVGKTCRGEKTTLLMSSKPSNFSLTNLSARRIILSLDPMSASRLNWAYLVEKSRVQSSDV